MTEKARRRTSGARTESGGTGPADTGEPSGGSDGMLAMVLTNDRETRLERRPVPTPRDGQVLVDIDLCGICGSDLDAPDLHEVYLGGFIMGHEPTGRIARVGRDVSGWRVG
jgi:D-arabinose 1-dehydrogenase-like Zn-dependent alcohol dehydrogenase